jgi:coenzyme F420-dependent glucose-6-phosphate dehydrogenase
VNDVNDATSARTHPALGNPERFELGYWLSSEEHGPDALVAHARAAEDAGFEAAMISDHFAPWVPQQGQSPFVWAVLGAIAVSTERLRLGTGVTAPVFRMHPVAIAQAAATTAVLMPGRFFLGLGTGERLNEHAMGRQWPAGAARRRMLREALSVIRDLLDGDTVTRTGEHFAVERATIHTRPATPPPIAVAGGGRRSAQLAGELADGLIGVAPDADLVTSFEHAGGTGKPRLAQLDVCWAMNDDDARHTAHTWWPNAALPPRLLSELALPSEFAAAAQLVTEDAVADAVVCGPDPEPYVRAIHRYVAAGYTTVHLHQVGPDQQGFLDFAKGELLPRFAA